MSDQFVAEIRIFPFNFPPTGWAFCDGQLMPISQNTALFSLLGTFYGGDGKSTFALPDLQGSVPMQTGQGQGLTERFLGEQSGVETITLLVTEIPIHTHNVMTDPFQGDKSVPAPDQVLAVSTGGAFYVKPAPAPPLDLMAFQALPPAGGGLPHNNLQPYLTLNFCIALQGIFPQRP
jgi:microcystin-dependent protein